MKHAYIAPKATSIKLSFEAVIAQSLQIGDGTTKVDSRDDILSNKKENPIWGESKSGMWDGMK